MNLELKWTGGTNNVCYFSHMQNRPRYRIFSKRFEQKYGQRYGYGHVLAKNIPFLNAKTAKLSSDNLAVLLAMWRRGRDLNSRYRFKPVYSLSRRAPSADSDTSPRATDAAAPRMQKRNLAQYGMPVKRIKRMNIIAPYLKKPVARP